MKTTTIKRFFVTLLTLVLYISAIPMASIPVTAATVWPTLSSSAYCEFTAGKTISVYRDSACNTRGTCNPAKSYNASIAKGDLCRIIEIASSYIKLDYPTSAGYKTGFIKRSELFDVTAPSECVTSKGKVTTYVSAGGSSYGYIATNDKVYACGTSGSYSIVVYSAKSGNRAYKLGYIKTTDYQNIVMKTSQPVANGIYTIVSALNSNKVIDISNASKSNSANVQLYSSNGTQAQQFEVTYNSGGYYTIKNIGSGLVLDVAGGKAAAGTNVQQYQSNSTAAQRWYLEDAGNGYYYIRSALGYYLDVSSGSTRDGANIQIWTGNKTNAQKFKFVVKTSTSIISNSATMAAKARLDEIACGTRKYNSNTVMKVGSKFTGTRSGEQCKGYARNVFLMCFGINPGSTQPREQGKNYLLYSTEGMTSLGSVTDMTEPNISKLFMKARPGDFVQMRRSHGGSHSAIVYQVTAAGVTFLEANIHNDNVVYLQSYTWAELCAKNAAMTVYTATNYTLK